VANTDALTPFAISVRRDALDRHAGLVLVLPMRPVDTLGWSEERLAAIVTRDSMIGVSRLSS
jgi:hypothetical protein